MPINVDPDDPQPVYTVAEVDALLAALPIGGDSDSYTKAEVDALLAALPAPPDSYTKAEVDALLAALPPAGAPMTQVQAAINTAVTGVYRKPAAGIPKSDLASDVQASLGKADSAVQPTTPTPPPPSGSAQPTGPTGTFALRFEDTFSGTSLDLTKWSSTWFGGGSQNGVSTSPSNVRVSGGNLILTLSSSTVGASVNTNPNDKAGNASKVGYQFTTGVIEARIRFPGNGTNSLYNWAAWWTDGQSWPTNGEHDIAEILGGRLTINYHYSGGGPSFGSPAGYWGNQFHTYTLHRKVGSADIYYDGVKVASYPTGDSEAPQYMILNVGTGQGSPVVTGAGSEVQIDYVRAWQ